MSLQLDTTVRQRSFDREVADATTVAYVPFSGNSALECDSFPFEVISDIAERESWRKEINRPVYHIHKWWARRLGTAFRAITLGALTPAGTDVIKAFYQPTRLRGAVVFDPFMGSGTTVGEASKLGANIIGRDINPVAYFLARNALTEHDRDQVRAEFRRIEADVADRIRGYYTATLPDGQVADVLYYFWVKLVPCPHCQASVELFSSRIFARHTNPRKFSGAYAVCPECGEVNCLHYGDETVQCDSCQSNYDPRTGPVRGATATCPSCRQTFPIAQTARCSEAPPGHRLYAKLVLMPDGTKRYLAATDEDQRLYGRAVSALRDRTDAYPVVAIAPGHNTDQARGYNYRYWHEMFNERQLLCLSILADRIRQIREPKLRELFTCLFSGVLEFNNMFASYKGEGTGAVRPLFSHHVLAPERTPLEGNVWGTRKSSGSFLTMFERRICRALDYADNPFEVAIEPLNGSGSTCRAFGLSDAMGFELASNYKEFVSGKHVYLSCGDSSKTDLADCSVDAVITDPPFFDNVHYSELADFFHVWQRHILGKKGCYIDTTTRSEAEVQSGDVKQFVDKLRGVWAEAHRVLKDNGQLVFSYHHSRAEGWRSVLEALMDAGFRITAVQPVKGDMSVAIPKMQAAEPINLDVIMVCRKQIDFVRREWTHETVQVAKAHAAHQVDRFNTRDRALSRGDLRVIVMSQLLRQLSGLGDARDALENFDSAEGQVDSVISTLRQLKRRTNNVVVERHRAEA